MLADEVAVECEALVLENTDRDLNTCLPQHLDATPSDTSKGVNTTDNDARHAVADDKFGTRRGTAIVGAGFEADIQGCVGDVSAISLTDAPEGIDLGVSLATMPMPTLANDAVLPYKDGSNHRIGDSTETPVTGYLDTTTHPYGIVCKD